MSKEKTKKKTKKDAIAELDAKWKRALADYQNLTKEMANERIRMRENAVRDVALAILPILDNFDAAMAASPAEALAAAGPAAENWAKGVGYIQKQMIELLNGLGVERIEAVGKPFDAGLMEAVGEEDGEGESGTVLKETCAGYTLGEAVIRPSKVIISN